MRLDLPERHSNDFPKVPFEQADSHPMKRTRTEVCHSLWPVLGCGAAAMYRPCLKWGQQSSGQDIRMVQQDASACQKLPNALQL